MMSLALFHFRDTDLVTRCEQGMGSRRTKPCLRIKIRPLCGAVITRDTHSTIQRCVTKSLASLDFCPHVGAD